MKEILANSPDPFRLTSILQPIPHSGGFSLAEIIQWLVLAYGIPLTTILTLCLMFRYVLKRPLRIAASSLFVIFAPALIWITLVYSDEVPKGMSNFYELPALGALVGLVIGMGGAPTRTAFNSLTTSWVICAVALMTYIYVPASPVKRLFY